MATALDYSQGRPSAAAVKGAGHVGVVRYVGTPGRTKNITKAEYADMLANGVSVALVYENHDGDSAGGYSGGQAAARTARADADSVGWPRDRPIYFAVDSDQVTAAQFAAVLAYLDGAASVMGGVDLTGVYGEYDVIEKAVGGHARYGWQTVAWSGGKRSTKAVLFQRLGQPYVGGIQVDVNDILAADWGQNDAQEDDMPTAQEIAVAVGNELMSRGVGLGVPKEDKVLPLSAVLKYVDANASTAASQATAAAAGIAGLAAAFAAATTNPGITPEFVKQVVTDAVKQSIKITGTVDIGPATASAAALPGGAA